MKKSFLLAGGFALALFFAACGDDSSSGNNVDQETDESSSSVEDSTDVSSSSAEYKDPTWPEGARAATLDDLKKYYLVKIKGETFHLGTGSKNGMFSLWSINESSNNTHIAMALVMTDFKNGIINLSSKTVLQALALDEKLPGDKVLKDIVKSADTTEISFIVEKDVLKYRVGKEKFVEAKVEQLEADETLITDASKLDKNRLVCEVAGNDTVQVYSFYKGRYMLERVVGKDTVSWNAGYMDTYRGFTSFVMKFASEIGDWGLITWRISSKMDAFKDLSKGANISSCTRSDFKYSVAEKTLLMGDWKALSKNADVSWKLNLNESMRYVLKADNGGLEQKEGYWDVYGDVLLLKVETMLDAQKRSCASAIKGNVTGVSEKGFTYNHSDKCSPAMPKTWEVPVYEE